MDQKREFLAISWFVPAFRLLEKSEQGCSVTPIFGFK
jgi:hypothetical protein